MYSWGGVLIGVRRAAITACAASFFAFVAFLIFQSNQLQSPPPYYGVWLAIPPAEEVPIRVADAAAGEGALHQLREGATTTLPGPGQTRETHTIAASSTQVTSSAQSLGDAPQGSAPSLSGPAPSQSPRISLQNAVTTPIEGSSVPVSTRELRQHNGPIFAINLESTIEPIDRSAVAMNPEIESHRLYVTRFEKDGQNWHRLRVGFFLSETAARQALTNLQSFYPDAWVTRIPAEEALASAATAIYEPPPTSGNPTLLARVPPEPLGEPPETAGVSLSLTMPETVAGSSVAFGTVGGQQSAPESTSQAWSNSPSAAPQTAETSVLESSGAASRGFRFRGTTYRASSSELAMLQRWDQNAGNLQEGGTNSELEGQDGLLGYALGLEGEANVERRGPNRRLDSANEWKQSFAAHGDLSFGRLANLQFKNQLIEQRDEDEEYIGAFMVRREPDQWRQNRISSSNLTIGLLDDRLTSNTVLNTSRYTDSDLDGNYVVGYQLLQRLALDVWRGEDTRVSVFGAYGEVGQNFNESLYDDADKIKKKMNAFSEPGQAGIRFGGTFGLGPADLTVRQTDSWDAENSDGSQETAYETTLGLDVNRLRGLIGALLGETFWNIAPDSVYLSYGLGAVDPHSGAATEDSTTDMSAGANWNWESGYGYLSYWSSFYDNRQPESEDYDWAGDGLDVGGGMWGNRWNFDGWLSLSRSEQMGEWSESSDLSLGGGLSVGYRLDELPDLKVSLSSDHYRGDYIASHGTSQSGSWVFTSELDFTKYWAELWDPRPSNLGLVFQLRNDSSFEKWGGNSQQNSDTNYFIGLTMNIGMGE